MNTKTYTIEKAWKMNTKGFDVQDGWDLLCNGNWCQRFYRKRDAKEAMMEAIKEDNMDEFKRQALMVVDRKTGKLYDPKEAFDKLMNTPEVMASLKRLAVK